MNTSSIARDNVISSVPNYEITLFRRYPVFFALSVILMAIGVAIAIDQGFLYEIPMDMASLKKQVISLGVILIAAVLPSMVLKQLNVSFFWVVNTTVSLLFFTPCYTSTVGMKREWNVGQPDIPLKRRLDTLVKPNFRRNTVTVTLNTVGRNFSDEDIPQKAEKFAEALHGIYVDSANTKPGYLRITVGHKDGTV